MTVLISFDNIIKSVDETDEHARVAQLVERDLAKVEAAGSSPVSRSFLLEAEILYLQGFPPFFLLKKGCIHLNTVEYTAFKPLILLHLLKIPRIQNY